MKEQKEKLLLEDVADDSKKNEENCRNTCDRKRMHQCKETSEQTEDDAAVWECLETIYTMPYCIGGGKELSKCAPLGRNGTWIQYFKSARRCNNPVGNFCFDKVVEKVEEIVQADLGDTSLKELIAGLPKLPTKSQQPHKENHGPISRQGWTENLGLSKKTNRGSLQWKYIEKPLQEWFFREFDGARLYNLKKGMKFANASSKRKIAKDPDLQSLWDWVNAGRNKSKYKIKDETSINEVVKNWRSSVAAGMAGTEVEGAKNTNALQTLWGKNPGDTDLKKQIWNVLTTQGNPKSCCPEMNYRAAGCKTKPAGEKVLEFLSAALYEALKSPKAQDLIRTNCALSVGKPLGSFKKAPATGDEDYVAPCKIEISWNDILSLDDNTHVRNMFNQWNKWGCKFKTVKKLKMRLHDLGFKEVTQDDPSTVILLNVPMPVDKLINGPISCSSKDVLLCNNGEGHDLELKHTKAKPRPAARRRGPRIKKTTGRVQYVDTLEASRLGVVKVPQATMYGYKRRNKTDALRAAFREFTAYGNKSGNDGFFGSKSYIYLIKILEDISKEAGTDIKRAQGVKQEHRTERVRNKLLEKFNLALNEQEAPLPAVAFKKQVDNLLDALGKANRKKVPLALLQHAEKIISYVNLKTDEDGEIDFKDIGPVETGPGTGGAALAGGAGEAKAEQADVRKATRAIAKAIPDELTKCMPVGSAGEKVAGSPWYIPFNSFPRVKIALLNGKTAEFDFKGFLKYLDVLQRGPNTTAVFGGRMQKPYPRLISIWGGKAGQSRGGALCLGNLFATVNAAFRSITPNDLKSLPLNLKEQVAGEITADDQKVIARATATINSIVGAINLYKQKIAGINRAVGAAFYGGNPKAAALVASRGVPDDVGVEKKVDDDNVADDVDDEDPNPNRCNKDEDCKKTKGEGSKCTRANDMPNSGWCMSKEELGKAAAYEALAEKPAPTGNELGSKNNPFKYPDKEPWQRYMRTNPKSKIYMLDTGILSLITVGHGRMVSSKRFRKSTGGQKPQPADERKNPDVLDFQKTYRAWANHSSFKRKHQVWGEDLGVFDKATKRKLEDIKKHVDQSGSAEAKEYDKSFEGAIAADLGDPSLKNIKKYTAVLKSAITKASAPARARTAVANRPVVKPRAPAGTSGAPRTTRYKFNPNDLPADKRRAYDDEIKAVPANCQAQKAMAYAACVGTSTGRIKMRYAPIAMAAKRAADATTKESKTPKQKRLEEIADKTWKKLLND